MARKQLGMFDEGLIARIDAIAEQETGGNRRLLVERVMRHYLSASAYEETLSALEATPRGDTQAASSAERSSGHRTRDNASATGAVTARGASRPSAPPRAHGSPSPSLMRQMPKGNERPVEAACRSCRAAGSPAGGTRACSCGYTGPKDPSYVPANRRKG